MDSTGIQFLKKVSTLRQVVELGGLTEVAQLNQISTSAVSQAISGLEKALDRKLFVRNRGRLIPTQHCVQLLESAAGAFQAIEEFSQVFHPPLQAPSSIEWLDFGVSHCIASDLLPRLVEKLKGTFPEIRLKLKTGRCQGLLDWVKKGELCMALVAADEIPRGLSAYPILEERLGIYISAQRGLLTRSPKNGRFAGLAAEKGGHPVYYTRFLRSCKITHSPELVCDSYESLVDIAAAGILPTILPERLATRTKGLLREVTPGYHSADKGSFSVYLVSQKMCDPEEDQFLLREIRSLI